MKWALLAGLYFGAQRFNEPIQPCEIVRSATCVYDATYAYTKCRVLTTTGQHLSVNGLVTPEDVVCFHGDECQDDHWARR